MRTAQWIGVLAQTIGLASCSAPPTEDAATSHAYECSVDQAWAAVKRVLADLDYRIVYDLHDEDGGVLRASRNDVGEVVVRTKPYFLTTTLVTVTFPNENRPMEEMFLARVDAFLRAPSPGPSVPTPSGSGRGVPWGRFPWPPGDNGFSRSGSVR